MLAADCSKELEADGPMFIVDAASCRLHLATAWACLWAGLRLDWTH